MKVMELFNPTGDPSQSVGDFAIWLDQDNCIVENKTRQDNAIWLHMKRISDEAEGSAYLRVKQEFKGVEDELLNWAFAENRIIGLTLNELKDLDTNLSVTSVGGRLTLSRT